MICSLDGIKIKTGQCQHLLQEMYYHEIATIRIKIINQRFMDQVKFHCLTGFGIARECNHLTFSHRSIFANFFFLLCSSSIWYTDLWELPLQIIKIAFKARDVSS